MLRPRLRLAALPAAIAACLAAAPAGALQRLYVANINGGTTAVVDAESRTLLSEVRVGEDPDGVAVAPDGTAVFVANFRSDSVSVIDTGTDQVVATIPVGAGPVGVAASPTGDAVYVASKTAGTLSIIDPTARSVVATVVIGADQGPNAVAVSPDGTRAYVTNSFSDTLAVVDTAARRVIATVEVGRTPNRVALSLDGHRAYVGIFNGSTLAVVDTDGPTVVSDVYLNDAPTGVALSPDGRALFVVGTTGHLHRIDTATLDAADLGCDFATPYGIVAQTNGAVLVADMTRDEVAVLPPPYTSIATVPVSGGPFALATLPRETPPLESSIDAPASGTKLDPRDTIGVRVSVRPGTAALLRWIIVLHDVDGQQPDRALATSQSPVHNAAVGELAGSELRAGGTYELVLDAFTVDGAMTTRRSRFTVPQRQSALVPLESVRGRGRAFEMDADGTRFVRWNNAAGAADVIDAVTGAQRRVAPPLPLASVFRTQLSRDGRQLALSGSSADGNTLLGILDLEAGFFDLLPVRGDLFDLDATGRFLATFLFGIPRDGWNYVLVDTAANRVVPVTNEENLDDVPPTCRPYEGGRPVLSADGATLAFATAQSLGFPDASGCSVFAYDSGPATLRFVASLGSTGLDSPAIDDAGSAMSFLLLPHVHDNDGARATLLDLATGTPRDLLGARSEASYDAAVSGDAAVVVTSSCADLDPTVGNTDHNQELFRYDVSTDSFHQITDSRGGTLRCEQQHGQSLAPQVSRHGDVVAFLSSGFGAGACRALGPQRDAHTGLAFGAARAVPIVAENRPPRLDAPGALRLAIGAGIDFNVAASDADADPLAYFAELDDFGLPAEADFVAADPPAAAMRFFWYYPGPDDVGDHSLRLGAFDGRGGEDIRPVALSICRFVYEPDDVDGVVVALFGSQPTSCGPGDTNHDGTVSAADLIALRTGG